MSFFGDVLKTAAPIAAGYFTGGAATPFLGMTGATAGMAAGALTGAGIAALSGDDILMGGVSGGLGGYGGGGLGAANAKVAGQALANNTTNAVLNKELISPFTTQSTNIAGGNVGMFSNPTAVSPAATQGIKGLQGSIGPNMSQVNRLSAVPGQVVNPTTGMESKIAGIPDAGSGGYELAANEITAAKTPTGTDYFTDVMEEYGGGLTRADGTANPNAFYKGVGKTAMTGLPVLSAAMQPELGPGYDSNPMNSYDPNRQLDLSMDTNIDSALAKDSGLRLLAEGGYLDGGNVGDGMSDDIPATINGNEPAALADGEFVVPADVVSHLGNGSSNAGSRKLYEMMNEVRRARTGNEKQGKQINPERYMPA